MGLGAQYYVSRYTGIVGISYLDERTKLSWRTRMMMIEPDFVLGFIVSWCMSMFDNLQCQDQDRY